MGGLGLGLVALLELDHLALRLLGGRRHGGVREQAAEQREVLEELNHLVGVLRRVPEVVHDGRHAQQERHLCVRVVHP